jgi:hypothetical protein
MTTKFYQLLMTTTSQVRRKKQTFDNAIIVCNTKTGKHKIREVLVNLTSAKDFLLIIGSHKRAF